jgi:hypothetical protein
MSEEIMQPNLRKSKIIALVVSLFLCAIILVDTFVREKFGHRPTPLDADSLALLKKIFIFMSVYGLATVLAFQFWRASLLNRLRARFSRFSPETLLLVINYPLLIAPALYGQLLYYCGIPFREFFYFISATIVMILVWAIYDFRKA